MVLRKAYQNAKEDSNITLIGVVSTVLTATTTSTIITFFAGYLNAIVLAAIIGLVSTVFNEVYRRTIKTTHLIVSGKKNDNTTVTKTPAEMFTHNTANNIHENSQNVTDKSDRFFTKHFGIQFILLFIGVSVATTGMFFLFDKDKVVVEKTTTTKIVPDSMTREQTKQLKTLSEQTANSTDILEDKVSHVEDRLSDVYTIKEKVDDIDNITQHVEKIKTLEEENKTNKDTISKMSKDIDDLKKQIQDLYGIINQYENSHREEQ